jgi:hypothetical protein
MTPARQAWDLLRCVVCTTSDIGRPE